jgi:hypothetical protein
MKRYFLFATCALPLAAAAQQGVALQGRLNTMALELPKRARLYTQLSDTSNPQAATRFSRRLVVHLVHEQPASTNWLLVRLPSYRHCKVGVAYPPDPTYYISKATATQAKRSILL